MPRAVMIERVGDVGQRHTGAGALHPVGQHRRPRRHPLGPSCPRPPACVTAGPAPAADTGAGSGPCSSTTCAFVPPRPNDDTPARRGPSQSGHGARSVGTNNRVGDASIAGFHCAKLRFGGIWPRCTAKHGLDEPRNPGGRLQMADIRLHRPQSAWAIPAPIDVRQRFELDRITQSGTRAVRLNEIHRARRNIGAPQRPGDHVALRRAHSARSDRWSGHPD